MLSLGDDVTYVEQNPLDGDWVNPRSVTTTNALVSEFPSGDGTPGGMFDFVMTPLPGDLNLDNVVNYTDWYLFQQTGPNALFTQGDFTGDGWSSYSGDAVLISGNFGVNAQNIVIRGDIDGDWDVDNDDLDLIEENLGMTGAAWEDGDFNGDGSVTTVDRDLALAQFAGEWHGRYGLFINAVA